MVEGRLDGLIAEKGVRNAGVGDGLRGVLVRKVVTA